MSKRELEIDVKVNGRPCVANIKGVPTEAYFHCWEHWSNVVGASALVGGHAAGQVSMVHAIVELQDGRVCRCDPADVCFTPVPIELPEHLKCYTGDGSEFGVVRKEGTKTILHCFYDGGDFELFYDKETETNE